jgi:SAM-dependent methyltransferase
VSDPYSRVDYRRLVAWPERIAREWPFLERVLATGPSRRLLDLGCGTGEHARFLAAQGFDVTGVDRSESMLARAREQPLPPNLRFVEADLEELDRAVEGSFGGAICLGNTLPHLRTREALDRFLGALHRRLAPGGPAVIQIINYERVFEGGLRHLPLNFRRDEEGREIVFLRLMEPHADGGVSFFPSTLRLAPEEEPPLTVEASKRVELHGWRRAELDEALAAAGFTRLALYGDFAAGPFAPESSPDLLIEAR